jgi:hypothetical protein
MKRQSALLVIELEVNLHLDKLEANELQAIKHPAIDP